MEYTTITIGRQFGSRGREIAKRLAKTLNYQYYDKELLVKVAQKSGLTTEFLENTDERQTSPFFYSLLTSPSDSGGTINTFRQKHWHTRLKSKPSITWQNRKTASL